MKFATTTGDFASYCDNDTRRRHALIDVGFGGYFTLECGSSIIKRKYRLGNRRPFDKDTRLADPPRFIKSAWRRHLTRRQNICLSHTGFLRNNRNAGRGAISVLFGAKKKTDAQASIFRKIIFFDIR